MLIDIFVVFAILCFAVLGYTRGFIKSAASLVKVSISAIIAFLLASPTSTLLNNIFGLSKTLAKIFKTEAGTGGLILTGIVTIIIFLIIRGVLHWLVKFAEKSHTKSALFNRIDRWLGALFGILRFAFIFSLIAIAFYVITLLPFLKSLHSTIFTGSKFAIWLYDLVIKIILAEALAAAAGFVGK